MQCRALISRPHDGHTRLRFLRSSALFCRPAYAINQPTPSVAAASVATCGSKVMSYLFVASLRAWGCARKYNSLRRRSDTCV